MPMNVNMSALSASKMRPLTSEEIDSVVGGYRELIASGEDYVGTDHTEFSGAWCIQTFSTWVEFWERDDVTHELVYEDPQWEFDIRHEHYRPIDCHGSTKA